MNGKFTCNYFYWIYTRSSSCHLRKYVFRSCKLVFHHAFRFANSVVYSLYSEKHLLQMATSHKLVINITSSLIWGFPMSDSDWYSKNLLIESPQCTCIWVWVCTENHTASDFSFSPSIWLIVQVCLNVPFITERSSGYFYWILPLENAGTYYPHFTVRGLDKYLLKVHVGEQFDYSTLRWEEWTKCWLEELCNWHFSCFLFWRYMLEVITCLLSYSQGPKQQTDLLLISSFELKCSCQILFWYFANTWLFLMPS